MDITRTHVKYLAVSFAILLIASLTGCGGSGPSADRVAREANADACTDSGYAIVYRADQSQHTIWDCQIGGRTVCVGEDHGIASDVTVQARLVFATALGGKRPDCLA